LALVGMQPHGVVEMELIEDLATQLHMVVVAKEVVDNPRVNLE
jgi:hypothetical protein